MSAITAFLQLEKLFSRTSQLEQLVAHIHEEPPCIGLVGQWLEDVSFKFRLFSTIVPAVKFGSADVVFAEHETDADVETDFVDDPAVFLQERLGIRFPLDELQGSDRPLDLGLVCLGDQLHGA